MLLMAAVIWKFTDFLKNVRAGISGGSWNSVITQLLVWAAALGGVFLLSASDFGTSVVGGIDKPLNDLDGTTKLVLGLMGGSFASGLFDSKKAVDNSDSAAQPPLLKQ
jgi:hypothetical protein